MPAVLIQARPSWQPPSHPSTLHFLACPPAPAPTGRPANPAALSCSHSRSCCCWRRATAASTSNSAKSGDTSNRGLSPCPCAAAAKTDDTSASGSAWLLPSPPDDASGAFGAGIWAGGHTRRCGCFCQNSWRGHCGKQAPGQGKHGVRERGGWVGQLAGCGGARVMAPACQVLQPRASRWLHTSRARSHSAPGTSWPTPPPQLPTHAQLPRHPHCLPTCPNLLELRLPHPHHPHT